MTITELIDQLTEARAKFGDDVRINDTQGYRIIGLVEDEEGPAVYIESEF